MLEGMGEGISGQVCVQMCLRAFHGGKVGRRREREQKDEHDRSSVRLFRCDGGRSRMMMRRDRSTPGPGSRSGLLSPELK